MLSTVKCLYSRFCSIKCCVLRLMRTATYYAHIPSVQLHIASCSNTKQLVHPTNTESSRLWTTCVRFSVAARRHPWIHRRDTDWRHALHSPRNVYVFTCACPCVYMHTDSAYWMRDACHQHALTIDGTIRVPCNGSQT